MDGYARKRRSLLVDRMPRTDGKAEEHGVQGMKEEWGSVQTQDGTVQQEFPTNCERVAGAKAHRTC